MDIQIGNRVRSFDFAQDDGYGRDLSGERACYVEGEVIGFDHIEGCQRYRILVDRDVFGGKEEDRRVGRIVTPPVNGTPTWSDQTTNYVEVV
ncbi:MAG: hypothetical protein CME70_19155 [Halobacteriovorax sp.]|nr:hypothetical protein [Halobacteriovorax sp.]|tara:strand:- start:70239 stop:70514 length:276 start_codon:yes stop_codon:yes gene_type:complete